MQLYTFASSAMSRKSNDEVSYEKNLIGGAADCGM